MYKPRIAVLRGGPSAEYDVSMRTGASVLSALEHSKYEPVDVVISRKGEWIIGGFERKPKDLLATIDGVFIALHGSYGEDGTIQRMLDLHKIPYTGSKAYASSVGMNKLLTKEHLLNTELRMAPHMKVVRNETIDIPRLAHSVDALFGPEFVVKPLSGGSSIDTYIATSTSQLASALTSILKNHEEILIEKRIHGREATCAVIESFRGEPVYALPAIEIVVPESERFFSHTAKYSGITDEICPGRFSNEEKKRLAQFAQEIHTTLGLSQYSRSDFILAEDGIYFLEVNTLPGLTKESLVPKALDAIGCSYQDFITHLLMSAVGK